VQFHPATTTSRNAVSVWLVMVAALALLAAFRSDKLVSLAWDMPPSPLSERLVAAAEGWDAGMEALGLKAATTTALAAIAALRGRDGL